jgi:hypothetical protein
MKFIRWVLATQKREDAKWVCIAHEMNHSFVLAVGDDYSQLTWANI